MILRQAQGLLSFATPATVLAGPSLAHDPLGGCLARTLITLTPIAACNVLADIPAGTELTVCYGDQFDRGLDYSPGLPPLAKEPNRECPTDPRDRGARGGGW